MHTSQLKPTIIKYTCLITLLVFFLACYQPTLLSLHSKWIEWDGAYAHSYIIIGLITYFIIERRYHLQAENWHIYPKALVYLLIAVGIWQAGQLSLILSLEQIALPLILFALTLSLTGTVVARQLLPFFMLLLLTLPLWDVFIPFLQTLTVIVNTYLLGLIDLPANIQQFYITIPAGIFHVATGCSGLSHMMTSLTTASLFAIEYRANKATTLKLFTLAIIFGLISNWVRVFGLIVLGQSSNMQSPIIKDHGNYGLIINGIFIVIYCLVCLKYFRKKPSPEVISPTKAASQAQDTLIVSLVISIILLTPNLIQAYYTNKNQYLSLSASKVMSSDGYITHSKQSQWIFYLAQHDFDRNLQWGNGLEQLDISILGYRAMNQQKKISSHTFKAIPEGWKLHQKYDKQSIIFNSDKGYALLQHNVFLGGDIYAGEKPSKSAIIKSRLTHKQGVAIISTIQSCHTDCRNELLYFSANKHKISNLIKSQLIYQSEN